MAGLYDIDKVLRTPDYGTTIFRIDARQNPFSRLVKTGKKPKQMTMSWPAQADADKGYAGVAEGTDKTSGWGHSNRTPIKGSCMVSQSEGWHVTDVAVETEAAAVADEVVNQTADDAFNFARMLEKQRLSAMAAREEGGGNVAQSGGVFYWLNPVHAAATEAELLLPVNSTFRCTSDMWFTSALSALTPAAFEAMVRAASEAQNRSVNLTGFVGSALKAKMSQWLQKATLTAATEQATLMYSLNAKEATFAQTVDFFEFDGNKVNVIPAFNMLCDSASGAKTAFSTRSGAFLDMSLWEQVYLAPVKPIRDDTKSGGPRGFHKAIHGLKCFKPIGQLAVYASAD